MAMEVFRRHFSRRSNHGRGIGGWREGSGSKIFVVVVRMVPERSAGAPSQGVQKGGLPARAHEADYLFFADGKGLRQCHDSRAPFAPYRHDTPPACRYPSGSHPSPCPRPGYPRMVQQDLAGPHIPLEQLQGFLEVSVPIRTGCPAGPGKRA